MFNFKEPSTLKVPWFLSGNQDVKIAEISLKYLKDLKRYDILAIDYLYQKYREQLNGVILNVDDGFNVQLQVAIFLNTMFNYVEQKFLIMILAPEDLLLRWHYHLCTHADLKVIMVRPETCPEEFDEEHGVALLVSFSDIKLVEHLIEYKYFSVVIDRVDEVANKLLIRRLKGEYNIGLSQRNFYLNPDQKLHWTMMNWCNPGCVGKLSDFYEIDNDNFANFRDNYRHWWFRLTWNFCESFVKPNDKELEKYDEELLNYASSKNLLNLYQARNSKVIYTINKRKVVKRVHKQNVKSKKVKTEANLPDKLIKREDIKKEDLETESNKSTNRTNIWISTRDGDSSSTRKKQTKVKNCDITEKEETPNEENVQDKVDEENAPKIYSRENVKQEKLEDNILEDLFNTKEENITPYQSCSDRLSTPEQVTKGVYEDDDVLMSFINNTQPVASSHLDHETQVIIKKEEVLSQILDDSQSTSNVKDEDGSDFLLSLIENDEEKRLQSENSSVNVQSVAYEGKGTIDIDNILKEADRLLKK